MKKVFEAISKLFKPNPNIKRAIEELLVLFDLSKYIKVCEKYKLSHKETGQVLEGCYVNLRDEVMRRKLFGCEKRTNRRINDEDYVDLSHELSQTVMRGGDYEDNDFEVIKGKVNFPEDQIPK